MSFELNQLVENEDVLEEELRNIAEKHGLNPVHLKEIVRHSSRGKNQSEIAEKVGVSRNTVRKYLDGIRGMNTSEVKKTVLITSLLFGGMYFLYDMLRE